MPDQFLDFGAGGAEIFPRIELLRTLNENFADRGGHRHAEVGVNVHLGAADAARDLDVRFRHAGGVFAHLAAVFVDLLRQLLRNTGRPVQHERIITHAGV